MQNKSSLDKENQELRERLDCYKQVTLEQARQLTKVLQEKTDLEETLKACRAEVLSLKSENDAIRHQLQLSKHFKDDSGISISFSVEKSKSSNDADTRTVIKNREHKRDKRPIKISLYPPKQIVEEELKNVTGQSNLLAESKAIQSQLRRSGSMVDMMQDGKKIQSVEYKEYIENFTNKATADRIKHLVDLCTPLDRNTPRGANFFNTDPAKKQNKFFGFAADNITEIQKFIDVNPSNELISEIDMFLESAGNEPFESLISQCFVIGCEKKNLSKYLNDRKIDFSFIYNKSFIKSEQPCNDIITFFSPFNQQIRTKRILNTVGKMNQLLFQDDIKGKNSDFFVVSLNSNIECEGLMEIPDMLKESNPSLFYNYYCIRIEDFFIREEEVSEFTNDVIDFHFYPKYYVIKTLYPLSSMFQDILSAVVLTIRRKKIERFMNSIVGGKIDIQSLSLIDAENFKSVENEILESVTTAILNTKGFDKFDHLMTVQSPYLNLKYSTPIKKNASFIDADFGLHKILNIITFEDFLFINFSIMQEMHVVFVSDSPSLTTAALCTFLALMRPFRWPLPIIFNLPEDLLPMLGSPVPVLVGLNRSSQYVISQIIPKTENSDIIYVFLDHGLIYYKPDIINNILLPQYDDFLTKSKTLYRKSFNSKPSLHIRLGSTSKGKYTVNYLKKNNYDTLLEKIAKIGKENSVKKLEELADGIKMGAKKPVDPETFKLFHFFKHFYHAFIVSKLPLDGQILESQGTTVVKNIDVEFFSSNPADLEFLKSLMDKQSFVYFLENDLYQFNTKNVSRMMTFL